MKHLKDLTEKELMQNIFASQIEILRRLERLESANAEMYDDVEREKNYWEHGMHLDAMYEKTITQIDELSRQLNANIKE